MSFKVDYQQAKLESELQDGTYAVRFEKYELKQMQNGVDYINLWFRIREDVDQPCKKFVFFEKIFKSKETGEWLPYVLQNMGKVFKFKDGKTFKSVSEFLKECVGKVCTITLETKEETHNGKTYTNQRITKWQEYSATQPVQGTVTVEEDDDLPF